MAQAETHDSDEIDLAEIAQVLWSRRLQVFLFVFGFAALGYVFTKAQTPIYQSTALVQLEERASGVDLPVELQALTGGSGGRAATEIEILRSRSVAGDAVSTLDLQTLAYARKVPVVGNIAKHTELPVFASTWTNRFSWSDETISVGLLRAPDDWLGEDIVLTKSSETEFSYTLPNAYTAIGSIGVPVAAGIDGFSMRIDLLKGNIGQEYIVTRIPETKAVSDLIQRLDVTEVGRQSSILRLNYQDPDPSLASKILDTIVDAYVRQNIQRGAASAEKSLEFIEERLPEAEAQVQSAQLALNAYQRSVSSVDLTFETQQVLSSAAAIEIQLNELEMAKAELALDVTPNHPSYKRLDENQQVLEEQLQSLRVESQELPELQLEVFNLNRELQVAQEIYQSLLQRKQELQVVRASTIGNIRIVDTAFAESRPIRPRTLQIIALSAVLGLIAGISGVLIPRALRRTVGGVEDIEKLGLSVFASIGWSNLYAKSTRKNGRQVILAIDRPTDLAVEALRSLRTSLHFGMIDAESKSLAITSPSPDTGKSFIAVNLAAVIAQSGQKVVIIDADLRRGTVRKYFDAPQGAIGLSEVLAQEAKIADAIRQGPIENLFYVPSGSFPPNPSELLMREDFAKLIKDLSKVHDFVIVDAAPILAVTDPVILSRAVGATLLATRHKFTSVPEIEASLRIFESGGGRFMGAVLNAYRHDGVSGKSYEYNKRYSYDQN